MPNAQEAEAGVRRIQALFDLQSEFKKSLGNLANQSSQGRKRKGGKEGGRKGKIIKLVGKYMKQGNVDPEREMLHVI